MNREQRRKRRKIIRLCTTVIMMLLTAVVLVAVLRLRALNAFKGDYYYTIDLADQAAAEAALWLSDVEGADIDTEWVRSRMPEDMSVKVILSFEREGLKKGTYSESLDKGSYEKCRDMAYAALSSCLRELIIDRLVYVGYAESVSETEADALINEALGMTMDDYLKNINVTVLPDYDTLAGPINREGDYKIKKKTITWERDGASVTERFVSEKGTLSFPDSGDSGYVFRSDIVNAAGQDAGEAGTDESVEDVKEDTGGVINVIGE
ncbi:MAG: hypothetical protein IKX95_06740 [Lachnospiraceae bacterium]|nr:hypothetical protein [Lachnospiraceae bacterium]MBR6485969.1 hypothetical protein [Lachnospiraceae bacterium]